MSVRVTRFSAVGTKAAPGCRSGSAFLGMKPKYFSASASSFASSKSPVTARVALLGTYQAEKNFFTSESVAASRSLGEPIGVQEYGCVGG